MCVSGDACMSLGPRRKGACRLLSSILRIQVPFSQAAR